MSPRTILGIIHLSAKNAQEPRRSLRSPEERHGSSVQPLQTDFLSLGPHWPKRPYRMHMNELVELKKQKSRVELIPVRSPCSIHRKERWNSKDVCGLLFFE
jgi:hypothetical protein